VATTSTERWSRHAVAVALALALGSAAGVHAAEKMQICAYDGSAMVESHMKAKMTMKGKTLYFCTEAEHDRFMASPAAYMRIVAGKKYTVQLNFLTKDEYHAAMASMDMLEMMKPVLAKVPSDADSWTHYLIVTVLDSKTGEKVTDLKPGSVHIALSKPGAKSAAMESMAEPMMKYVMTGVDLSPVGAYKGSIKLNFGLMSRETLDFTYDVKPAQKPAAPMAKPSSGGGASHDHSH